MLVLVTGSEGLIGTHLRSALNEQGIETRRFDIKHAPHEDICDRDRLAAAISGVDGVVHLAAVSRVIWGENDPVRCRAVNVDGMNNLVSGIVAQAKKPWLLFTSSREVYGEARNFPVSEDDPKQPLNTYARSKTEGEQIVLAARSSTVANVCRLSTVYGSTQDHPDRLVPAFARVAALGGTLRVDGRDNFVDCTHVTDVCRGLLSMINLCRDGERFPPIHLVSGNRTGLLDLANMAKENAHAPVMIAESPPRNFDVSQFVGNPARAEQILGWKTSTSLKKGFSKLIADFAAGKAN